MSPSHIAKQIKQAAFELGFSLAGITPAARPDTFSFLRDWITHGYHGEMGYISAREAAYEHPDGVLPDVRSLILLGMNYTNAAPSEDCTGKIAKYAVGAEDYHDLLRRRLKQLAARVRELAPNSHCRTVVDTAPLLERDFARKSGLGWFGKNTLLINKGQGSYFFLGGILTDAELPADAPHADSHCGTCTRCLEACPTDAFVEEYILDARRCIAYLTIELRQQPIPSDLRSGIGDWLFGCDICQDVCPWNKKSPGTHESNFTHDSVRPRDAVRLLCLTDEEFRLEFRGTPLHRTGRAAIARNAAIVLGNLRSPDSIESLTHGLSDNSDLVRGAAAWALGQFQNNQSREILRARSALETDPIVKSEIDLALKISEN